MRSSEPATIRRRQMSDATATTNGELHTDDEALSVLLDGDIER